MELPTNHNYNNNDNNLNKDHDSNNHHNNLSEIMMMDFLGESEMMFRLYRNNNKEVIRRVGILEDYSGILVNPGIRRSRYWEEETQATKDNNQKFHHKDHITRICHSDDWYSTRTSPYERDL